MFKKLVSISLIFAMLLALVNNTIPLVWYYSNYTYIANHLCIHRNDPNSDCNGSCQLRRMIKRENHEGQHKNMMPQTERELKIDLFFTESISPLVDSFNSYRTLKSRNEQFMHRWFSEPPCPPPQLG